MRNTSVKLTSSQQDTTSWSTKCPHTMHGRQRFALTLVTLRRLRKHSPNLSNEYAPLIAGGRLCNDHAQGLREIFLGSTHVQVCRRLLAKPSLTATSASNPETRRRIETVQPAERGVGHRLRRLRPADGQPGADRRGQCQARQCNASPRQNTHPDRAMNLYPPPAALAAAGVPRCAGHTRHLRKVLAP